MASWRWSNLSVVNLARLQAFTLSQLCSKNSSVSCLTRECDSSTFGDSWSGSVVLWEPHIYWHCRHCIWRIMCETVKCPSICPSICLSHRSMAATYCGFTAECHVGRMYRSIAACIRPSAAGAGTQQQMRAVSLWQPTEEAEHWLVNIAY